MARQPKSFLKQDYRSKADQNFTLKQNSYESFICLCKLNIITSEQ